ncbi:hypothetical protein GCM10009865_06480 [Aeromicrobium ponti]|uniref:Uncharacterized protein n=1 Tax=Cytobacillus oceanisediminis TaxID=665099 RepID=A0A562K6R6_9BACI|nr:hypothetical protein [Cytobacillus oceanisediminis]TWH91097.1 hypothetical protein IQ19_00550 [Cytobacillus oceanisediminis]
MNQTFEIQAVYNQLLDAWNNRNAQAMADFLQMTVIGFVGSVGLRKRMFKFIPFKSPNKAKKSLGMWGCVKEMETKSLIIKITKIFMKEFHK